VSHGNASVTWRESQAAVGCSVIGGAHDIPAVVGQNDHHAEHPRRCRRHDEHVDGRDTLGLIAQESPPVPTENSESPEKSGDLPCQALWGERRQRTMLMVLEVGDRVSKEHPLRRLKELADAALTQLSALFESHE
jgi:hypothetical protein